MPYSSMSEVNPSLKGIKPPITLAQANAIASHADGLKGKSGIDNPWAVAIGNFKQGHTVKDGRWVKKEDKEFDGKFVATLREEVNTGVKSLSVGGVNYLVLWTSNGFIDREKEIIATKAWEDYVARRDRIGVLDRVWFWHIKGSDFASVVWHAVSGRMLVELARVDDTVRGEKMLYAIDHPEEFSGIAPLGWCTSHGYIYRAKDKSPDGVYSAVEKFESTVLPMHRASNIFGGIKEVLEMAKVTSDKKDALAALLGDDLAESILLDAEKASAVLEAEVAFKEDESDEDSDEEDMDDDESEDEDENTSPPEKKKEVDDSEDDDGVYELELDDAVMKEIASHVDVSGAIEDAVKVAVKEAMTAIKDEISTTIVAAVTKANVASKEVIVQDAMQGKLRLVPYTASESEDNVMDEKEIEKDQKARKAGSRKKAAPDPVKAVVSAMMGGGVR